MTITLAVAVGSLGLAMRDRLFGRREEVPLLRDLGSPDGARIGRYDLAEMNLACAKGLPGTEELDEAQCLSVLDGWVRRIEAVTKRNRHWYIEKPSYYDSSEAKYKIIQLVLTLQQDCGVGYDPAKISVPNRADLADPGFFRDASDVFLSGALGGRRRGTCASLPVLVVAAGRRLGYPLKLVATKGHVFARWESAEGLERFNIEVAGQGVDCYPDDYYRNWPFRLSEREMSDEGFLRSMGTDEEEAFCLELRGYCLAANERYSEAATALASALKHRPNSRNLQRLVAHMQTMARRESNNKGDEHEKPI